MNWFSRSGRFALAIALAAIFGLSSAAAQSTDQSKEPGKAEIDAARSAIAALHATSDFDIILPQAAEALKRSLIQAEPNLDQQITETVDEQALELAKRRGDLENEVATIYAKAFTLDELNAITTFYKSEPGKKLLRQGGTVTKQSIQAARIWSNGIARDLAAATHKALEKKVGKDVEVKAPNVGPQ